MNNTIRVFSGRTFSFDDIELIKWARTTYPKLPRSEFAATVCELLNWTTPAGRAKTQQCLSFLEQLEAENIIQLPKKAGNRKDKSNLPQTAHINFDTTKITGKLSSFEPITLTIAKPGKELKRWRAYVNQYHMLGDKWVFGSRLQYFIKSSDIELGCMQFSASSWALKDRDKWIGWNNEDKKKRLHLIINNSRYLIFPWVNIKNLASKALSLIVKQIQHDWLKEYCFAPVLIETFVDTEHFQGTCYKAANWLHLGKTKGLGRNSKSEKPNRSQKDIYVYPLQQDFKACLKGEKPYKVVDFDEQV
ncbi:MAG: Druantia anti-phage system protein DruA [Tepidanaerobacteraceae bacterium]|jgi:hypothetical protein|nr:DUF4338 domain-containing protein [Thermoanaerobacterales bacterium]